MDEIRIAYATLGQLLTWAASLCLLITLIDFLADSIHRQPVDKEPRISPRLSENAGPKNRL